MAFPALAPTARNFNPGDYPIRQFRSQSGTEIRILYGDSRTGMTLELSYDNISDANAELFLTHYNEVKGSYNTFTIPDETKEGWEGSGSAIDVSGVNAWRYSEAPAITAVRPGRSSVRVQLIGVL
jgi:hypothetical protein